MKILVPSSGREAASEIAHYVSRTAQRLDATLVALHILADDESEADGRKCCKTLGDAAAKLGVAVESQVARGEVAQSIIEAARLSKADLIVMGASNGAIVRDWLSADVMQRCEIPVLVVPHCYGQ